MSKTEYTSCEGLKFVVTGKLKVFANREELIDYIETKLGHELEPTNKSATKFNLYEIRL